MSNPLVFLLVAVGLIVFAAGGFALSRFLGDRRRLTQQTAREADIGRAQAEAESSAKEKLLEAKEEAVRIRTAAEAEAREIRSQAQQAERRLHSKEENLERRAEELNRREQSLGDRERGLEELRVQLEEANKLQLIELERVANMSRQEAQGVLMAQVEQDLRNEVARKVREAELADPEGRRRSDRGDVGLRAAVTQRRAEGQDHRPRRPQHPSPAAGHRYRPDHR
jgi:ribonuclease Y